MTDMHLTCWTYPWDLARLGTRHVLNDLADQGYKGIDLAATYHPISVLSPRGPHVGGFFSPSGAVHFPARPARYGRIKPQVWPDPDVVGTWHEAAAQVTELGMELNAWTIGLFQPWMAQQYPHVARVFPTGDRLDAGVCPSSPDVREYLAALAADLADQFGVNMVKLEGVHTPAYDYGWIRRRVYFAWPESAKQLMATCFCDACVAVGAERGIDVEAVREHVVTGLRVAADGSIDEGAAQSLRDDIELASYVSIAGESAAALVSAVAGALGSVNRTSSVAVATPNEAGGSGVPIDSVIDDIGTVLLLSVQQNAERVEETARRALDHPRGTTLEYMLHPPTTSPLGSVPAGINERLDDPAWLADLHHAMTLGVTRVGVYNYGLLTDTTFRALTALARSGAEVPLD